MLLSPHLERFTVSGMRDFLGRFCFILVRLGVIAMLLADPHNANFSTDTDTPHISYVEPTFWLYEQY